MPLNRARMELARNFLVESIINLKTRQRVHSSVDFDSAEVAIQAEKQTRKTGECVGLACDTEIQYELDIDLGDYEGPEHLKAILELRGIWRSGTEKENGLNDVSIIDLVNDYALPTLIEAVRSGDVPECYIDSFLNAVQDAVYIVRPEDSTTLESVDDEHRHTMIDHGFMNDNNELTPHGLSRLLDTVKHDNAKRAAEKKKAAAMANELAAKANPTPRRRR